MKTILISGGAGYLGTFLTQELIKKNKVVVYDTFYFPWLKKNIKKIPFRSRLSFIEKDINKATIEDFKSVDIVIDLNGISNDPSSELNKKHTWSLNNFQRRKFAKLARKAGVARYIFNSTCSVYGFSKKISYENRKKNPISTYAKANLEAEKYIYNLRNNSFKVNCLRNSTLFGFSQTMRLDLVVNIWVYNLLKNKNIVIDGDGEQFRPFLSLNDVSNVYKAIIIKHKSFGSFICNLVSFNLKIKNGAEQIVEIITDKGTKIVYNPNNKDKRNYVVGSNIFKNKFGKNFKFSKFKTEIKNLYFKMKSNKTKLNDQTIRMKYYKKILK